MYRENNHSGILPQAWVARTYSVPRLTQPSPSVGWQNEYQLSG